MWTKRRLWLVLLWGVLVVAALPAAAQDACSVDADYLEAGQTALDAADYETAYVNFDCATAVNAEDAEARLGRMQAALMTGRYVNAVADANVLNSLARRGRLADGQFYGDVIARFDDAVLDDPNNVAALAARSFYRVWAGGEFSGARESGDFERIMLLEPDLAYPHLLRGYTFGPFGGAADLDRALQLEPLNAHVWTFIGLSYNNYVNDDPSLLPVARAYHERAIELDPNLASPYLDRGFLNDVADDEQSAIEDFERALLLGFEPRALAVDNLRLMYESVGDYAAAAEMARRLTLLEPETTNHPLNWGFNLELAGDPEGAAAGYLEYVNRLELERVTGDPLELGVPQLITLTEGRVYEFEMSLERGQAYDITVLTVGLGDTVDGFALILNDDGEPLYLRDDISESDVNAAIEGWEAPYSGDYTLIVSHAGGNTEGDVEVMVSAVE